MVQLAVTHRMLYQILDKHDAVPDVAVSDDDDDDDDIL